MKRLILVVLALALLALTGCTTMKQAGMGAIPANSEWALLPFINNTETPYAADRAEAIASSLLFARGMQLVAGYPDEGRDELISDRGTKRRTAALDWAKKQGVRYAVTGTVTEWRYKVGLDGEPVVGLTLNVLDVSTGKTVWSGSAGRSGWSRDAVSAVAQRVLEQLIETIPVQ